MTEPVLLEHASAMLDSLEIIAKVSVHSNSATKIVVKPRDVAKRKDNLVKISEYFVCVSKVK